MTSSRSPGRDQRAPIRAITVVLTSQCNLRCGYCFQNDKKPGRMDRETLRRSIDLLLESEARDVLLQFYGGEPLLELDNLRWAVDYALTRARADQRVEFFLTTNGTLLDEESLTFLSRHPFRVQLSFDGVPEVQQVRSKDSFARLDGLLRALREEHAALFASRLRIGMTLTPLTIRRFADSVAYFLTHEVREIEVAPAITPVPRWQEDWRGELSAQFDRIVEASLEHHRQTGRIPFLPLRMRKGMEPPPRTLSMCGVDGTDDLAVDVNGDVHGCVMFADSFQRRPSARVAEHLDAMRIGNLAVEEPDLRRGLARYPERVRRAEYFHDKQEKRSPYGRCRECAFFSRCSVCPVSIGNLPGSDDPHLIPGFLCAWNLASLEAQDRFEERLGSERVAITSLPLPPELMGPAGPRIVELREGQIWFR